MHIRISAEGDSYEDREDLLVFILGANYRSAVHEAREIIRRRRKYGEGVSDAEDQTLQQILDALYIELE